LLGWAFDVFYQSPRQIGRLPINTAAKMTSFWFGMGLSFNLFILTHLGWEASSGFMQGFILEYMLSFDNLFVFHLVFSYYCTPEALVYRALYFGIAGAIVLRICFISLGYSLMNTGVYLVKFAFGAVLVYSGIKTAQDEEEDPDPGKNQFVAIVMKVLPISDHYDPQGHFFIDIEEHHLPQVDARDRAASMEGLLSTLSVDSESVLPRLESFEGSSLLNPRAAQAQSNLDTPRTDLRAPKRQKATLLLLVVIALWAVDLVFALDSVASKLASVNDIFLNVSSSAFAMMGLRSLYFVMESLVQTFHMLKYGISAVLVLIGLKMFFSVWFEISNSVTFVLMLLICALSAASSYWLPSVRDSCRGQEEDETLETPSPEGVTLTLAPQEDLEPMTPSRPVPLPVDFDKD